MMSSVIVIAGRGPRSAPSRMSSCSTSCSVGQGAGAATSRLVANPAATLKANPTHIATTIQWRCALGNRASHRRRVADRTAGAGL